MKWRMALVLVALALLTGGQTHSTSSASPPDADYASPPDTVYVGPTDNRYLAELTWPLFHRNPYAQASGDLDAIAPSDRLAVQREDNPEGGTAPWTVFPAPYSDGSQAIISNTQKGVIKWSMNGPRFEQVSYLDLPRGRFDFDWNVAALRNGEIAVTSIKDNRIYLLKDRQPDCPRCELVINRTIDVARSVGELTIHFTVSYDGHLLILMEDNKIAAISIASGEVAAVHSLGREGGGYSYHNAFASDEEGRIYISNQQAVTALDWDGQNFTQAWQAPYDFRGPGCREPRRTSRLRERLRTIRGLTCTGSGTTPTLLGTPETGIVLMTDGHSPSNNLVAFWRGEIPADWRGLPGMDRRLAGRIALPHSTPDGEGHTAENSPAVLGNSVFIAQWAGFNPDCTPPKGVQRVDWDAAARRFRLVWANADVHFNGIPTASSRTGLVYGTGRGDGCTYAYRALDIATGQLRLDLPLGADDAFTDQGNQQAIANDGSIVVGVRRGTLRIYRENMR